MASVDDEPQRRDGVPVPPRREVPSCARSRLGAPDAKLAFWDGVVESRGGQWVYPARGLAVFTALADTELARVVVFPLTSVAACQARLARATEAPRENEGP